jgi:hypothetical protein
VIVRAGRRSLHAAWLDARQPRTWDLVVLPFEPLPLEADDPQLVVADVVPGPKWSGLRSLLTTWDGWRSYDRVWLPDDDLMTSQQSISEMFQASRRLGLDLFAPALDDSSYFAHYSTMRNHSFGARRTGFVEIMMPGFTTTTLDRLLPTLDLTETGWGWGLDSLWPHLLDYRNVGVIDAVPVLHTRPVGQLRDADLVQRIRGESDRIMREHDCAQVHTVFEGYGAGLEPLDLSAERLVSLLSAGWQHLIHADPRVLSWVVEYQRSCAQAPDYPIEGTPTHVPPHSAALPSATTAAHQTARSAASLA